jgi:hypothetical protein
MVTEGFVRLPRIWWLGSRWSEPKYHRVSVKDIRGWDEWIQDSAQAKASAGATFTRVHIAQSDPEDISKPGTGGERRGFLMTLNIPPDMMDVIMQPLMINFP